MRFILLSIKLVLRNNLALGLYHRFRRKFLKNVFVNNKSIEFNYVLQLTDSSLKKYIASDVNKKQLNKVSEDFIDGKINIFQEQVNYKEYKVSDYSMFSKDFPGKEVRFIWEIYRNKAFFNIGLDYYITKNEEISC